MTRGAEINAAEAERIGLIIKYSVTKTFDSEAEVYARAFEKVSASQWPFQRDSSIRWTEWHLLKRCSLGRM